MDGRNLPQHSQTPRERRGRSQGTPSPAVSQRVTTKLVKVAKAFGLERYEIIFETSGRVRLAVGNAASDGSAGPEPNDFDREFG